MYKQITMILTRYRTHGMYTTYVQFEHECQQSCRQSLSMRNSSLKKTETSARGFHRRRQRL